MRTLIDFACDSAILHGVCDQGARRTGLLVVSGGNEIAIGPQRAMARLARRIADAGWPVFRFDRRGIGDSDGENRGFATSGADIAAAAACFARNGAPRIVAFGNCDAATALALGDPHPSPIVARVLANPWLDLAQGDLPAPAAIKRHYRDRLTDPAAWRALLGGRIDPRKAIRGLARIAAPSAPPPPLATRVAESLGRRPLPTRIVLSERDGTGIAFADAWRGAPFKALHAAIPVHRIATASHGFTGDDDLAALAAILIDALHDADAAP